MSTDVYTGSCLCGSVKIEATDSPSAAGLCHCEDCRTWHAAPVNAFAVWHDDAIKIIEGNALLERHESGTNIRHWCRNCGSGLMNRKPNGITVIYAMVLAKSGYVHKPSCHIHCDEAIFDIQDGLPKYIDMPKEWGGSGETVPEPSQTGLRATY